MQLERGCLSRGVISGCEGWIDYGAGVRLSSRAPVQKSQAVCRTSSEEDRMPSSNKYEKNHNYRTFYRGFGTGQGQMAPRYVSNWRKVRLDFLHSVAQDQEAVMTI